MERKSSTQRVRFFTFTCLLKMSDGSEIEFFVTTLWQICRRTATETKISQIRTQFKFFEKKDEIYEKKT